VLAELQLGAHAGHRRPDPIGVPCHLLVDIAQAEISARWHDGGKQDAVGLWLDLLTLCADSQPHTGGGAPEESIAFWTDARTKLLSDTERNQLGRALARLDARLAVLPDPRCIVASNVHLRDLLHTDHRPTRSLRSRLRAWPFGFDPAGRELAAFWELAQRTDEFDVPANGGAANQAQWRRAFAPPLSASTATTEHITCWLRHAQHQQRRDLTELRLLRLALTSQLREDAAELADPFADGPLAVTIDADAAVFRSASGQSRSATR
jgi:hypothetical protein